MDGIPAREDMIMATDAGNLIASMNGRRWEAHIQRTKGIPINSHAVTDSARYEVKSCQEWTSNGDARTRGRYVFYRHQHRELIKRNGSYILIVHRDGRKIGQMTISARRMGEAFDLETHRQTKISWLSILDKFRK